MSGIGSSGGRRSVTAACGRGEIGQPGPSAGAALSLEYWAPVPEPAKCHSDNLAGPGFCGRQRKCTSTGTTNAILRWLASGSQFQSFALLNY